VSDYQAYRDACSKRVAELFELDRHYTQEEAVALLGRDDTMRAVFHRDLLITNDWKLVRRD
jgi:hypothetical protein